MGTRGDSSVLIFMRENRKQSAILLEKQKTLIKLSIKAKTTTE